MAGYDWMVTLRERIDAVEVLSEHTPLKRAGRSWRGPCPLHGGEGPNFSVVPEKQSFKCFVCGRHGDVFDFLREHLGWDFMTAARTLAERYGVDIPKRRRVNLAEDEKARADAQASYQGAEQESFWDRWEIENSVPLFHLGMRAGTPPTALVPIWSKEDQAAPGGWLAYAKSEGGLPRPLGMDPLSREGLEGEMFLPPGALHSSRELPLLFVPDPIVAIRLYENGYYNVFSVVGGYRSPEESWLRPEHVQLLRDRSRGDIEAVGLVVPVQHENRERASQLQRALYATEPILLSGGIQPLLVHVGSEERSDVYAWNWACTQSVESLAEGFENPQALYDVFELRIRQLIPLLKRGQIGPDTATEKVLPSLIAAHRSGNVLLYEAYLAWTVRSLGLNRVNLATAVVRGVGEEVEEVF